MMEQHEHIAACRYYWRKGVWVGAALAYASVVVAVVIFALLWWLI